MLLYVIILLAIAISVDTYLRIHNEFEDRDFEAIVVETGLSILAGLFWPILALGALIYFSGSGVYSITKLFRNKEEE